MPDVSDSPKIELSEMMLAMDVVDTLRYQQSLVERELASDGRDQALIEKVRSIYASQGIDVTDEIIARGVAALREDRYTYTPRRRGFKLWLARCYVNRGRFARIGAVALLLLTVGFVAYYYVYEAPRERAAERLKIMPDQLSRQRDAVLAEAVEPDASQMAEDIYQDGMAALARKDGPTARKQLGLLTDLYDQLTRRYTLRVVSRPGEPSGVWRIPKANASARNYYLIVEAIAPDGTRLTLPVTSEEDGETRRVDKWGVRVSPTVFSRVQKDKQQDGIVDDNILGEKKRGYLEPEYTVPSPGGAITQW